MLDQNIHTDGNTWLYAYIVSVVPGLVVERDCGDFFPIEHMQVLLPNISLWQRNKSVYHHPIQCRPMFSTNNADI